MADEYNTGPVPWDPSTWGTGTFTGGNGDSPGVFVPLAETIAAAAQAPSWLAPEDYAASGFTPEGVSTSIAPSNPYESYSQTGVSASTGALDNSAQGSAFNANVESTPAQKIQNLADTVFSLYRTNQNYDQQLNQLNSLYPTDPAAYFKARIGLSGQQMGWQIGQGTPQNNATYQQELQSFIPGAKAAGVTDAQIQNLINTNAQTQAKINAERIASDAKGPQGWVNQNIPGGYGTLAAAAAIAAPYLAPELFAGFGAGEAGSLAASGGLDFGTGFTGSGFGGVNPLTASGGIDFGTGFTGSAYNPSYYDQFVNAFSNTNELSQPYAPLAGAKVTVEGAPAIYNDYGATNTPLVNATNNTAGNFASGGLDLGSNFTFNGLPLSETVAGTGLTIGQILGGAGGAATLASLLSGTTGGGVGGTGTGGVGTGTGGGGTGGGTGGGGAGVPGGGGTGGTGTAPGSTPTSKIPTTKLPIPKIPTTPTLSTALRNPSLYQSAPGGLYRGNVNPFTFGKDVPIQGERQNYDPFAALNVAQTPPQSNSNLMANLLRENIYG